MALTPEQIKAGLKKLKPSQITEQKAPVIMPSTTTTTTNIMPKVTQVQPLSPKQNIMSPSLEVQSGVQQEKDYKALATPEEKAKVIKMLQAGYPEETVRAGFRQAIDRRLTQENIARGQEPKTYVDQNNQTIYKGDLSLKGGVKGVKQQFNKGEWNDQLIPQAKPTFAYTEGDIAKGGTTGFKNLGKMIGNAPASIYNVGANVGNMILNPIDTAEGLASLVGGVATKGVKGVVNALGGDGNKIQSFIDQKAQEPGVMGYIFNTLSKGDDNASMLADALVDRYGSIDKLTKTVVEDPVGFVSDVSTIVGGASSLASKGAKIAGKTQLASNLQKVSTAMDVIDPYTQIPKAVNKAAISVVKPIAEGVANVGVSALGKMTGTSADTIKQVYKSAVQGSDEARAGLRGNINDQDVLTSVQRGVEAIKDDRNLAYGNDYKILKANTNKLDIRNIGLETLQSMYDDLGVSVDKKGKLDFSQSKITSKAAQSNLQDIITDIKNWKDKTPAGLDILKQRVQDYYRGMPEFAKSDRFSTMVSNKIKDLIVKEVPEYAKMQENYGKMQSILSDIKSAISVGGKAGNSTIITKLKGVLRDNQEFRQAMVRKLEEYSGKDVMGQIAGLQMNPVLPKGLVGAALGAGGGLGYLAGMLTNPATLVGLLGTSPRLVGEFANAVGVSVNLINKVVEKAKSFIPDGNNGGSNSPSILSKLSPTPDGGNNMKTSAIIPTKKTTIPTKTVIADMKVVAPKVKTVKTPVTVASKSNNTITEPTIVTKTDKIPKTTPIKQEVVQSTTTPKKQSVLPKPQEKQAVLDGKKEATPVSKEAMPVKKTKVPEQITKEITYTKSPEGKRLAEGKPIKEDSNTYRMLDRAEQRKIEAKKAKEAPVSKELEPLYNEAKKYDSADEWLRSNLEPGYDPRINMSFVVKTRDGYIGGKVTRVALRQTKSGTKNIDLKLSNGKTITFDPGKKGGLLEFKDKSLDIQQLRKIREEANK